MKLTILQVGQTPEPMLDRFERFPPQYQEMLKVEGEQFSFETIFILDGEKFPDHNSLEGVIITGSAYGVYESPNWINPLRDFIKQSYAQKIPMLGICFGHQIMADALGGRVEKSKKGWGVGRHTYEILKKPAFFNGSGTNVAITASHQDQVITAPSEAEIFMASKFTPNAGLIYKNGAAMSMQPHPEFDKAYSKAIVERLRIDRISREQADIAEKSLDDPLDSAEVGAGLARFFTHPELRKS